MWPPRVRTRLRDSVKTRLPLGACSPVMGASGAGPGLLPTAFAAFP